MSLLKFICSFILIWGVRTLDASDIVINEFMASNFTAQINSDKSDFVDWIELYNSGDVILDIGGIYVTDDLAHPFKWQLPENVLLHPNAFYIIWADGLGYENHASFKLSEAGEQIGVYHPDGRVIDTLTFGKQRSDISFGRFPNAGKDWHYFPAHTCGSPNSAPGLNSIEQSRQPKITPESGFFSGNVMIKMDPDPGSSIRYTRDGSIPTITSPLYSGFISLDETSVFRARTFQDDKLPSEIVTHSYVINEPSTFPVISISIPPEYLFDEEIGITTGICISDEPGEIPPFDWSANYWNRWERPIHVEYFTPEGNLGFKQDAGIAIFGGFLGRQLRQKAFTLYARNEYGDSDFDFPLFPSKPCNSYRRFILRCSSNDFNRTYMRDAMMQTLTIGQMDVDYQAYQPVIVYLNGDFWGLYNMREKTNRFYAEHNFSIDADSVDLIEGIDHIAYGDGDSYLDLIDFVTHNNMTHTENFEYVKTQMDVREFMNYYITEIYVCNHDWLHQNIKCWKEHGNKGKWRWLLYDMDWGFNGELPWMTEEYNDPTIQWVLEQGPASVLFQRLFMNKEFKTEFAQRFITHLNLTFHPERVHRIIQTMTDQIEPEIPRQIERWGALQSMEYWNGELDVLYRFGERRPAVLSSQLEDIMMPEEKSELILEVSNENAGWISVFDTPCPTPIYGGPWFNNIPLQIKAHAKDGWQFVRWIGSHPSTEDAISISLQENTVLHAVFEPHELPSIMVSEIHYNPSNELHGTDEDFEFLELLNHEEKQMDVSGYYFSDGIDFIFPQESYMGPGECIILAANQEMYSAEGIQVYQVSGGKLNNSGERLCLRDRQNMIVDQVHFDDHYPWPREADGEGPSLELIDPLMDNGLASSWKASGKPGGTPGVGIYTGKNEMDALSKKNTLLSIHPNPFHLKTHIKYSIMEEGSVTIGIYNMSGREVDRLYSKKQAAGIYETEWIPENLPAGLYLVQILLDKVILNGKVLLIN